MRSLLRPVRGLGPTPPGRVYSFRKVKEIKWLRRGVPKYASQEIPQIHTEIAEKGQSWMETRCWPNVNRLVAGPADLVRTLMRSRGCHTQLLKSNCQRFRKRSRRQRRRANAQPGPPHSAGMRVADRRIEKAEFRNTGHSSSSDIRKWA